MPDYKEKRPNQGGRNPGNHPHGDRWQQSSKENANQFYSQCKLNESWITQGADPSMVEFAEKVGEYMAKHGLTKSKIRGVYGEVKRIQLATFEKEKASFYLLKPKMAYAVGRDKNVKEELRQGLILFKMIFDVCFPLVTNENHYVNFCNLMEAILAYHKAYGGSD